MGRKLTIWWKSLTVSQVWRRLRPRPRTTVFFYVLFFTFVDLRRSPPKLVKVDKTGKGGATYHFEQIISGKFLYFELLCESVSSGHISLVCSRRPKCTARKHLPIIGEKLKIVKTDKRYKLQGAAADLKNVANYGTLFHHHTAKCRGLFFLSGIFSRFFQIKTNLMSALQHAT